LQCKFKPRAGSSALRTAPRRAAAPPIDIDFGDAIIPPRDNYDSRVADWLVT